MLLIGKLKCWSFRNETFYPRFGLSEPSVERQRETFEKRELELMAEVRDLRKRLAARRQQRAPDFVGHTQQWLLAEKAFFLQ